MTDQPMPAQRVTLITLGVRDLARSRAFYRALGWQPARATEEVSFYQMQGSALALFGLDDLAQDMGQPVEALGRGAITLAQNFPTEAEVDAAWEQAVMAGAQAVKPPQPTAWGGYSAYFADPDGHVWELTMNPFWPLSPDGSLTLPTDR